jgi:ABC-type nitrate/sulfonate/bicarbonate transport system substrate-binding protein
MLAGRFDAAMMPGEELVKLQAMSAGRFYLLASAAVEYPDLQVDGIQVRGRWASEHPDAVRALLTAQLQAHRLIRAEPDVLRREAVGRLRLDPAIATAIADAHLAQKIWDVNGGLTEAGIASTIAFLVETKGLPRALAPADVADLSYLEHVLRAIGRAAPSGEVAPAADPGMP